MSESQGKKRDRSANFSLHEVRSLVNLIEESANVLENKRADSTIWQEKDDEWNKITNEFNSQNGQPHRTTKTLRIKYEGLKRVLRKKVSENKLERYKTGDGLNVKISNLTDYERQLLSIISLNVEETLEPIHEVKIELSEDNRSNSSNDTSNFCEKLEDESDLPTLLSNEVAALIKIEAPETSIEENETMLSNILDAKSFGQPAGHVSLNTSITPQASTFTPTTSGPRQGDSNCPPQKEPRFDNNSNVPVAFDKAPTSSSLKTHVSQKIYQVFCSNQQITFLCDAVYDAMVGRDERMAASVSALQLEYVTCLCYIRRLLEMGLKHRYATAAQGLSELRNATKGIQLPAVVAKYIETLGPVMMSQTRLAPWVGLRPELFAHNSPNVSPSDILKRANRKLPKNYWWIDVQWIMSWINNTTRPSRLDMQFRTVDFECEGSLLVLVTRRNLPVLAGELAKVRGESPIELLDSEAIAGAIYGWRTTGVEYPWGRRAFGVNQFRSTDFNVELEWNYLINRSFTESSK